MRRFLITAMQSNQGKTITTMALLAALKKKGISVQSYKVGPDYIDPSFHQRILKKKSYNLDSFFLDEEGIHELFNRTVSADVAIIEGVMGYYDGLGGTSTQASSYEIGEMLEATGILVIQPRGSSLSLAAQVKGILDFRSNHLQGIVLSRCSSSLYDFLKPLLEKETGLKVLGYLPDHDFLRSLDELHELEEEAFEEHMEQLAQLTLEHVDMDLFLSLAEERPLAEEASQERKNEKKDRLRLAYAKDEAFAFLYHENLRVLEEAGFELVPFSPLRDSFPSGCSGLYLCGGYQEHYLEELSQNKTLLVELKEQLDAGLPLLCEGGGYLYLHEALQDKEGKSYKLVGHVPGECIPQERLQQFGYVELRAVNEGPFLQGEDVLRAHFYHRWQVPDPGSDLEALRPISGRQNLVLHQKESFFGGMAYLYLPSEPRFAQNFYDRCKAWRMTWVED